MTSDPLPEREVVIPTLFVGSSSESLDWARAIQVSLGDIADVALWNQSTFQPGWNIMTTLLSISGFYDFAVFIVSGDDTIVSRGKRSMAARDNVLFEYGVFVGKIGPERTFYLYDQAYPPKLPSDLQGITCLGYSSESASRLPADKRLTAVAKASYAIRERIKSLGTIKRPQQFHPTLDPEIPQHRNRDALKLAVVEDNAPLAESIAQYFRLYGFNVVVFNDGYFAFEIIKMGGFDVVISDWSLPGMTGTEICESLRQIPEVSRTLLIMISGFGGACSARTAKASGANYYFSKPASLDGVYLTIKKWFSKKDRLSG